MGRSEVIIEGNENARHRITSTSAVPGTDKYQDAYRSELTGLYNVIYIIETICEKHNIRSGGITAAYDGLNSIKKSTDVNPTYSCQSNHFNLISAIDNKLMKYEQGKPLDRW